jgi:hypothetical protein
MTTTTINQNEKKYWKLIEDLGDLLGNDADEMHALMKYKFLSYKQDFLGDEMVVVPSTSKLNSKDFEDYLTEVEEFASNMELPSKS